jgi:poly(3-hydroxybutyrate) depolymerase
MSTYFIINTIKTFNAMPSTTMKNKMISGLNLMRVALLLLLIMTIGKSAIAQTVDDLQARTFTDSHGNVLPYRLFVPANYTPGRKYPLVLFLHGAGERGNDNRNQLASQPSPLVFVQAANQASYPAFMVAPQCPWGQTWNGWESATRVDWPLGASVELLDALQREFSGIDASRLVVTGLSMGGFGTWDAITRFPGKFQKAIPICGGGDQSKASLIVNTPVWAFHSADDNAVPVERSRDMISAVQAAGGSPRYTEYCSNGLICYGHFSWYGAYADADLLPWVFNGPVVPGGTAGNNGGTNNGNGNGNNGGTNNGNGGNNGNGNNGGTNNGGTNNGNGNNGNVTTNDGIVSGATYRLIHRGTNKCLDVSNNSSNSGANVQQWTYSNTTAQHWIITLESDGFYKLTHEGTPQCLEVSGNSNSANADVQQYYDNTTDAQRWAISLQADGSYKLTHKGTTQCLDVSGNSNDDGADVRQYNDNGSSGQRWVLEVISLPNTALRTAAPTTSTASNAATSAPAAALVKSLSAPLAVYPNPATEQFYVSVSLNQTGAATCTLTDQLGRMVRTQAVQPAGEGTQVLTVDVRGLPAGLYVLRIKQEGGGMQTQRVSVQP